MMLKKLFLFLFLGPIYPLWGQSLFQEYNYRSLIADRHASQVDDLLTVIVLENANAQASTDLASAKEIKAAVDASYNTKQHNLALGLNGKGKSLAKTGRNGSIKAAITTRIKQVLANGSYEIEGKQIIRINGEQQTILLNGIVRPEDITPQNTILSTRIANAQINYLGQGSIANSERFNAIYKIMSFMGLV